MRVDVYNETDSGERIHWHGQDIALDAACVPAHSMRRMEFVPASPGLFFYHSHLIAAANLGRPYLGRRWGYSRCASRLNEIVESVLAIASPQLNGQATRKATIETEPQT